MASEEQRIFAGRLFDARCEELKTIKHRAHEACRRYNAMDEFDPQRTEIVRSLLGAIGENGYMQGPIQFNYGVHTFIGRHFFANFNLLVMDDGRIDIGDHVMIGPNVSLLATNHPLIAAERTRLTYPDGHVSMSEYARGIRIGNDVWIAAGVCVLDGVTSTVNIKVTGSITVPEMPPVVTFDPDMSYTKDEIAAYFESELDLTVTVYGYVDGAPTEETFESVHNAGVYYVEAVAGEASAHFLFTVNKAENALVTEFAREGWTYGEQPAAVTEPVAADGSAAVAYYTAYTSASDNTPYVGEFDALTPVGTYYAVVTVAESENYLAFEKVYTFAVAKAQNSWTGEFAAGWTYGESPVITLPTAAFGEVEVQYYISYGGDTDVPFDGEFSATTDAGTYYAVITVEGTGNYDGLNAVKEFTVQKASLNASVSISGWVYGETPSEPVVEGNVGGGEVTFTYGVQSGQGNTGTLVDGRPASVGYYTVSAHIDESTNYKASSVYYDFSVTAREVVIVTGGTEGLVFNGSAFTVTASADELLEEDDVSIVYTLADGKQSILAADTYTLNFELTGEDAFNYVIAEGTASTQVTVAKAEVTVTGITAPDGIYDGAAYDGNIEITYSAFAEEISAVEWQFRLADAEDDVWTPGLPTAAGEYVISVAGSTAANVTVTNTADFTATLSIAKAVVTYNATLASDAKVFFGETLTAEEMKALITPDQALAEAGFTVELLLADGSAFNAETPVGTTLKVVITPVISDSDNYVVTVTDSLTLIVQAVEVDIVLDIEDTQVADGDTVTIARGESLPVDAAVAAYMQEAGIPEGSYKIFVRGSEFTDTMYWAPGTYNVTVKLMNGYNGAMTFSIVVEEGEPPVDPDLPGPDEPDEPDEPDDPDVPGTDDPDAPTVEQPGEPDEGGFPGWAIAVIVCGGLAVVAIITSIAVVAARKRKASGKKDAA